MSKYPIFLFEGIECTGKTTQIKLASKFLKNKKIPHIILREPGGSKNSEKIRNLLLNTKTNFSPITDLFLYLASRNENVNEIINKNKGKKIVLIDRFIYSTLAYQHYGMNLDINLIKKLNNFLTKHIKIKHIFLHTVDKKNLLKRIKKRKNNNRYDKFSLKFYIKVQNGFIKLLKNKKNVTIINTKKTRAENTTQILNIINKNLYK